MTRKSKKTGSLGRALQKPQKVKTARSTLHSIDDEVSTRNLQSVTESNDLEEFLNSAVLADTNFEGEREQLVVLDKSAFQVTHVDTTEEQLEEQLSNMHYLAIPRRPFWDSQTTARELDQRERETFLEWRRNLVDVEQNKHLVLTPFEKNLEVWRQLWRVVERSDIVVQIVDSRNPLLFFSSDLIKYVKEVNPNKQSVLLLNKADLLTKKQRKQWASYFKENNIDYQYFSAYNEHVKLEEELNIGKEQEPKKAKAAPVQATTQTESFDHDPDTRIINSTELVDFLTELGSNIEKRVVVGMVGYPNVGKSSTINVLCKEKKVAESSTPGKTKHFQTIILNEKICLCDCPGLVFPSFIATKADMVCNGLLPIDQMRDHVSPVSLVCLRIPRRVFEQMYGLHLPIPQDYEEANRPPTPHELLQEYGRGRGYMTSHGQPDEPRSARYILKDYVTGKLLYAHPPPSIDPHEFNTENYANIPFVSQTKKQDSVTSTIEEMNRPRKAVPKVGLYQGKRKKKRTHQGEGQESVKAYTKGYKPQYGQKLPTNIRL